MIYLLVAMAAILGGIVQALTGFGCGIVIMVFLPHLFSVPEAATISNMITIFLIISFVIEYGKEAQLKTFPVPVICYAIASGIAIHISSRIHAEMLKPYFGLFLIIIAIYFAFAQSRIRLTPSIRVATLCALLSGLSQGFFGIAGPPMALYFLLISDTKERYVGSMQAFALFTSSIVLMIRIYHGAVKAYMLPMVVLGICGVYMGKFVGMRIVENINIERMKTIVYFFLGVSGFWTFISNIR